MSLGKKWINILGILLVVVTLGACQRWFNKADTPVHPTAEPIQNKLPPAAEEGGQLKVEKKAPSLSLPDLNLAGTVNGINPKEAAQFWNRWRLVTTRYRPDNEEQRFVFANALAWKAIEEKKKVFPSGAMFGKIAFSTEHDPSFPVSVVPVGFQRVQLMKKMKSGYDDSHGWTFALYTDVLNAQKFGKIQAKACYECHTLVPERDYVFSRPTFFSVEKEPLITLKSKFQKQNVAELDPKLKDVLVTIAPTLGDTVQAFQMLLFYGSLNESIGPLTGFSTESNQPYILIGTKVQNRFILTFPMAATKECKKRVRIFYSLGQGSIEDDKAEAPDYIEVTKGVSCNGSFEFESEPIVVPIEKKK